MYAVATLISVFKIQTFETLKCKIVFYIEKYFGNSTLVPEDFYKMPIFFGGFVFYLPVAKENEKWINVYTVFVK